MVDINCDMGEGFGIYSFAEDSEIMPFIDSANVDDKAVNKLQPNNTENGI